MADEYSTDSGTGTAANNFPQPAWYTPQPQDFCVTLLSPAPGDQWLEPGDTLFMRPFDGTPVAMHYWTVVAKGQGSSEFLAEYAREDFARNGWSVLAYTVHHTHRRPDVIGVMR